MPKNPPPPPPPGSDIQTQFEYSKIVLTGPYTDEQKAEALYECYNPETE
jgi:hypothetical protein